MMHRLKSKSQGRSSQGGGMRSVRSQGVGLGMRFQSIVPMIALYTCISKQNKQSTTSITNTTTCLHRPQHNTLTLNAWMFYVRHPVTSSGSRGGLPYRAGAEGSELTRTECGCRKVPQARLVQRVRV
jgi:uncharacterized protein YjhX (UPF0386 family)